MSAPERTEPQLRFSRCLESFRTHPQSSLSVLRLIRHCACSDVFPSWCPSQNSFPELSPTASSETEHPLSDAVSLSLVKIHDLFRRVERFGIDPFEIDFPLDCPIEFHLRHNLVYYNYSGHVLYNKTMRLMGSPLEY